jgi:transcription antitermination factor NusG
MHLMSSSQEVQELIQQLQQLQMRQAEILTRLAQVSVCNTETRELVVGDKVQIKNPGKFQENRGVVTKIGTHRVTEQTKSGSKVCTCTQKPRT